MQPQAAARAFTIENCLLPHGHMLGRVEQRQTKKNWNINEWIKFKVTLARQYNEESAQTSLRIRTNEEVERKKRSRTRETHTQGNGCSSSDGGGVGSKRRERESGRTQWVLRVNRTLLLQHYCVWSSDRSLSVNLVRFKSLLFQPDWKLNKVRSHQVAAAAVSAITKLFTHLFFLSVHFDRGRELN